MISKPFTFIRNSSLASGIYHDRFKYAKVRPIHKKGDKTQMTNYIPLPLLISFSKTSETLMFNILNHYLQVNKILVLEQRGFRKGNTTGKAIFTLTVNILTPINHPEQTGSIFCDLTEASDCVNHQILLRKMQTMGFVEQVPTGLKHIPQLRSKRLIYHYKIKKKNSLPVGKQQEVVHPWEQPWNHYYL